MWIIRIKSQDYEEEFPQPVEESCKMGLEINGKDKIYDGVSRALKIKLNV